MKPLLSLALLAIVPAMLAAPAGAQIYKCKGDRGVTVFSEHPCGDDATEVTVEDNNAGISVAPEGDFSKVRSDIAKRELERKIRDKKNQIERLELARERELAVLRDRKRYANNNLAGATWEESISTEMTAVVQKYQSNIENRREELRHLRESLTKIPGYK